MTKPITRNIQVLCNKTSECYSASLYEHVIDENGSISLDLLKRVHIGQPFHNSTKVEDKTIFNTDVQYLYQEFIAFVWRDLQESNHWLCHCVQITNYDAMQLFDVIKFFLLNPSFKSIEFYYLKDCLQHSLNSDRSRAKRYEKFDDYLKYVMYGHHQKSVKRAIYKSFKESVQSIGSYSTKADMIICRSFNDVNLIVRLLSLPSKHSIFENLFFNDAILFLKWLQKHYKSTSIVASICSGVHWTDIMRMAMHMTVSNQYAFQKFTKVNMNSKSLHDELIRINAIAKIQQSTNITYEYSDAEYSLEIAIADMKLSLVKDTLSLHEWGEILQNCLFGYEERIIKKQCLIIGVFRNDVLTYALELNGKSILQAHGKYNTEIPSKDFELIQKRFI
jgi:hypothetical protein